MDTIMMVLKNNGLPLPLLVALSYKSSLDMSLKNTLRKFDKAELVDELERMRDFYQEFPFSKIDMDFRIKSKDSCLRKYDKYYPSTEVEKAFNDILGFRLLIVDYNFVCVGGMAPGFRLVDMTAGKARKDGYCGMHLYYQPTHRHYPIEIQINTYYDRQLNNWLHNYLYKRDLSDEVGSVLRVKYENGEIRNENDFKEALNHELSDCEKIR